MLAGGLADDVPTVNVLTYNDNGSDVRHHFEVCAFYIHGSHSTRDTLIEVLDIIII